MKLHRARELALDIGTFLFVVAVLGGWMLLLARLAAPG